MFRRVSLAGSAELFKETAPAPDLLPEPTPEPEPPRLRSLPAPEAVAYYEYSLTEPQVRALIDAVQKVKYPHTLRTKPSMEEFEHLEGLRQVLLDGLR